MDADASVGHEGVEEDEGLVDAASEGLPMVLTRGADRQHYSAFAIDTKQQQQQHAGKQTQRGN